MAEENQTSEQKNQQRCVKQKNCSLIIKYHFIFVPQAILQELVRGSSVCGAHILVQQRGCVTDEQTGGEGGAKGSWVQIRKRGAC